MDFPKKEILNRGYSFCHFQCCWSALVSKLPTLPPNLENPFFQNGNPPFGKSQSKIGKNRFAMESHPAGIKGLRSNV